MSAQFFGELPDITTQLCDCGGSWFWRKASANFRRFQFEGFDAFHFLREQSTKGAIVLGALINRFVGTPHVFFFLADQEQIGADTLRQIAALHPLSSASSPMPRYRLFSAAGDVRAEGQVDPLAVMQLWRAIEDLPRGTGVQVDLSTATLTSHAVLTGLGQLCRAGVRVTIRGESAAIGKLRRWYSPATCPALQEA